MTRLPVAQVDSTVLRFHFSTRIHWTPGFVHWNIIESIGHDWLQRSNPSATMPPILRQTTKKPFTTNYLTTTVYITAGEGLEGAFLFSFIRRKNSTTTMMSTMSSNPPMTPPTIAPVGDAWSVRCWGLSVFPVKEADKSLGQHKISLSSAIKWSCFPLILTSLPILTNYCCVSYHKAAAK